MFKFFFNNLLFKSSSNNKKENETMINENFHLNENKKNKIKKKDKNIFIINDII